MALVARGLAGGTWLAGGGLRVSAGIGGPGTAAGGVCTGASAGGATGGAGVGAVGAAGGGPAAGTCDAGEGAGSGLGASTRAGSAAAGSRPCGGVPAVSSALRNRPAAS